MKRPPESRTAARFYRAETLEGSGYEQICRNGAVAGGAFVIVPPCGTHWFGGSAVLFST